MSLATIRLLLAAAGLYMIFKAATAPIRGRFLTLFGNVRRDTQPTAFMVCLIAGYALAAVIIIAAIFPDAWLPAFTKLGTFAE